MQPHAYPAPRSSLWQVGATIMYLAIAGAGTVLAVFCLYGPAPDGVEWWVLLALSAATILPGLCCAFGVAADRYRWEWVASGPLAAGLGILAFFEWLTLTSVWQVANALLITAFALSIAGRGLKLSLTDMEARREVLREIAEEANGG